MATPSSTPTAPGTELGAHPPLEITPAKGETLAAARQLLPDAFRGAMKPVTLVASRGSQVLGAAAVLPVPSPSGAPLLLGVGEEHSGGDIPLRLVEAAESMAREWGRPALFTPFNVVRGGAEAEVLTRLGFRRRLEEVHYTFALETVRERVAPLIPLAARRRPANTRLVRPDAGVDPQSLVALHAAHVGHCESDDAFAARLQGEGPQALAELSTVLLEDDRPVGMILQRRAPEIDRRTAFLESFVVVPERRGSWANIALLQDAMEALDRAELTFIRCCAGARHRQTHLLANDFGVEAARIEDRYFKALPLAEDGPDGVGAVGSR